MRNEWISHFQPVISQIEIKVRLYSVRRQAQ